MKRKVYFVFAIACITGSTSSFGQEKLAVEQVVSMALEKNYDVKVVRNTAEAANTDNSYAWGAFVPQLNATGSTLWNTTDQKFEFQDVSRNASGTAKANNTNASLQLVWTLFDGTRMFATRQRIGMQAEQSELAVRDQMVTTIANVVVGYYDIVRQKQQLRAIEEQMAVSEERVKLADRKVQVGIGAKPELLQARVDYNALRTQALQQQALITQRKEQLNGLLGGALPPSFEVSDTIEIDLGLKQQDIADNIENTNLSLQVSRRNLNIASLSLWERKAELAPTLNFNAAYNYARTNNKKLINPFSALISQNNGYNYGFSINVPILNNFNQRRLIQQAEITYNRQQLLYEQLKLNVDVSLRNAFVNYENAKAVLLIEEENILLARENMNIALETFKRGATTAVELRTAQQSFADAYTRLTSARYAAKAAEVELLRLKGGLLR